MLDTALKLLHIIRQHGFEAYLVGGFVRDFLLGITSNDIDVTTNAKPKEIRSIFQDACLPHEDYGSVTVYSRNVRFDITTYRKEIQYYNNRKPVEVTYIDDLREDLLRRDFTINTFCMDEFGQIHDLLAAQGDLKGRIIQTVGSSEEKFREDCLRILRAVRFATTLHFSLSPEVKQGILKTKSLLRNLSYERKREELDKIFTSPHVEYGISILLELGLDEVLELPKLREITIYNDLLGIWSHLEVTDLYPFTVNEKSLMQDIQRVRLLDNLDPLVLYQYGLYVNSVAGMEKGLSKKEITCAYEGLPIHERRDIAVTSFDIMNCLNRKPGAYLKDIYIDLEKKILFLKIDNKKEVLLAYCKQVYGT